MTKWRAVLFTKGPDRKLGRAIGAKDVPTLMVEGTIVRGSS